MKKEGKPRWSDRRHSIRILFHNYHVPTMLDDGVITHEDLEKIGNFLESDDVEMRTLGVMMLEAFFESWDIKSD